MIFLAQRAQVLAFLAFFIGVEARLLEFVIRDRILHAMHDELDALLDFGDLFRLRSLAQLYAGAGFVDQVNCLIWQEAVGNIAVRMRDGEVDGVVCISDGVEFFVAIFDAEQDLDCIGLVRRRNLDGLETPLERTIFLNRLAIFARRGCADALNLAARQSWLQDVRGVERAFCRSRAYKRMQFIDEDDGVLRLHQLFHDGLQPLFELSTIFRSGDDQGEIESQNSLVGQE